MPEETNDTQPEIKAVKRANQAVPQAEEETTKVPAVTPHHKSRFVPVPDGGLHELAKQIWPEHAGNPEQHGKHVRDLLELNRDILRDEHTHRVGQNVRVPDA